MEDLGQAIWLKLWKLRLDRMPNSGDDFVGAVRQYYFSSTTTWYDIYDLIEFIVANVSHDDLVLRLNQALESELSAFRFVGKTLTPITSPGEVQILQQELDDPAFPGVQKHLLRALEFLSDKRNPDYRNSIKESISAVESVARVITRKDSATLGDALALLEKKHALHPSLRQSFDKLYGYTSDKDGVRHAMLAEPNLTQAEAKFFLLSCTSFVNYLKSLVAT